MQKKLSIGTAIYNLDETFLREHIEGIQKQLTDETELLLIDDCSTNNSGEVCREYAEKDTRIRYIKMETNGGLSVVRNRTIEEAQGKWIFFADGDDLLPENFVSTALRFCDEDDDIIILERLKFSLQKPVEQPCEVRELVKLKPGAGRELSISCLCLDNSRGEAYGLSSLAFYHAAWGALYRRDFLIEKKLQFPAGQKKAQDAVFNTEAYFYAKNIAYLPYIMYYYRNNPQGITRRYSKDLPEIYRALLNLLTKDKNKFYADEKEVNFSFQNHRVIASAVDNLRLNIFHKDNPKTKAQRKAEFLAFLEEEPYKSAIENFDPKSSGRWEWTLPVKLMRSKSFNKLDLFVGNDTAFRFACGGYKRLAKVLTK